MIRDLFAVMDGAGAARLRRLAALLAAAAVLQGVAFVLLVPLLQALFTGGVSAAGPWLAAFAGVTLGWSVLTWVGQGAAFHAGVDLAPVLHRRLGEALIRLPLGWFGPARQGEVSKLASQGVLQLMNVPAHLLRPAVTAAVTPLTIVVGLCFVDLRLAATLAAAGPVLVILLAASNRAVRRADADRDAAIAESAGRVVEFAQHQPVLRAFGRTVTGSQELDAALVAESAGYRRMLWRVVPGLVGFTLAARGVLVAVLALGVYLALGGTLEPATLIAVLVLAVRFVEPVATAAELGASIRVAGTNLAGIRRVLEAPVLPEPDVPQTPDGNQIEFRDVHFGYGRGDDRRQVLRGVSFALPERTVTALVGPSGSGKTTIARLLARFWDVDSGEIRIGGVPVTSIATDDLMSRISFVFQDVYLFDGTLADNLRLARPEATDHQLYEAARLAGLAELAAELPAGLDTAVGEAGGLLSGGQRQRVAIARAILKDAPIVVLDEATSSLDPENDAAVRAAVATLAQRSTLLVIAHRLQTVRSADQILVVDRGQIRERGRHEELVEAGGTYARFWQRRVSAHGWQLSAHEHR